VRPCATVCDRVRLAESEAAVEATPRLVKGHDAIHGRGEPFRHAGAAVTHGQLGALEGVADEPSSIFDERLEPLRDDHHDNDDESEESGAGTQSILSTVCRLLCALDMRQEPAILVSTLILIERVVAAVPGLLSIHTWRPRA
jgi:hypothetical protein